MLSKKLKGFPLFSLLQKEKDIRHINDIVYDEINTILVE